jgi:hypothetical protein
MSALLSPPPLFLFLLTCLSPLTPSLPQSHRRRSCFSSTGPRRPLLSRRRCPSAAGRRCLLPPGPCTSSSTGPRCPLHSRRAKGEGELHRAGELNLEPGAGTNASLLLPRSSRRHALLARGGRARPHGRAPRLLALRRRMVELRPSGAWACSWPAAPPPPGEVPHWAPPPPVIRRPPPRAPAAMVTATPSVAGPARSVSAPPPSPPADRSSLATVRTCGGGGGLKLPRTRPQQWRRGQGGWRLVQGDGRRGWRGAAGAGVGEAWGAAAISGEVRGEEREKEGRGERGEKC